MGRLDRISLLPDCLLHYILSFIPTKEFIRTSVLSKRWIKIWKSVPHLDLDNSDFPQIEDFISFTTFILRNKLQNLERLDTFELTWNDYNDDSYSQTIETWLADLVSLNPKTVNIKLFDLDDTKMCFDTPLFGFSALENLLLWAEPYINGRYRWARIGPKVINLPHLRTLNLRSMHLTDEFVQRLMLGCPVLEEIFLETCYFDVTERITSSSLKKLMISEAEYEKNSMLRICTPSLEYLSCEVELNRVSFENLLNLEYASVTLLDMHKKYHGKGSGFALRGLSNAKTLQLSGLSVWLMLEMEAKDLPVFEKLESLELDNIVIEDMEPVASFLRWTPNLLKLTLQDIARIEEGRIFQWSPLPEIQCGSLTTLEIVRFSPDKEVDELVKFLLFHLEAIENVFIIHDDDSSEESSDYE